MRGSFVIHTVQRKEEELLLDSLQTETGTKHHPCPSDCNLLRFQGMKAHTCMCLIGLKSWRVHSSVRFLYLRDALSAGFLSTGSGLIA